MKNEKGLSSRRGGTAKRSRLYNNDKDSSLVTAYVADPFTSEIPDRAIFTSGWYPLMAADAGFVPPALFFALTSALASSSSLTTASWPLSAAQCSAVTPA